MPRPFVATLCERLGVRYGGWDAIAPLPTGVPGPGSLLVFHIEDGPLPRRDRLAEVPRSGTGILRQARVFTDHTEVFDGERLLARYDDLTQAHLFGLLRS